MLDATRASLGVLLILLVVPVAIIVFIVWHIRKLNRIEETVQEILKKLNTDERTIK
ncbi:hypothetical protein [Desulfosporosinus youngiae]|uniref:Uncharacterized protein n=1 Tax=Desulfosporosinus youngiae DSM 17734 TaxID=768710 RepID=H5Y4T3_9FIRM|nr:hypothetical protein [Desulfosporosinus youngiae]EHQ89819.1 hypothetical protein DesyoDRAFT_2766 [Desulfosporosinus youngiae DSM 17734]